MNHIQHVVVPGTFDPVTLGHIDVISRARHLFPQVTVAVAESRTKRGVGTAFTLEERVDMLRQALDEQGVSSIGGIRVLPFTGLLVDFCRELGAGGVVKGAPDIESVFVMSNPGYGYVSSSIVRELASLGSDVSTLVPPCVAIKLREHFTAE